jgi:hypothetical protein
MNCHFAAENLSSIRLAFPLPQTVRKRPWARLDRRCPMFLGVSTGGNVCLGGRPRGKGSNLDRRWQQARRLKVIRGSNAIPLFVVVLKG